MRVADYVDFLKSVTPDNQDEYMQQLRRFNMGAPGEADCPVFDGVFEYCAVSRIHNLSCITCTYRLVAQSLLP